MCGEDPEAGSTGVILGNGLRSRMIIALLGFIPFRDDAYNLWITCTYFQNILISYDEMFHNE